MRVAQVLWLMTNNKWFESTVDYVSIQSTWRQPLRSALVDGIAEAGGRRPSLVERVYQPGRAFSKFSKGIR